MIPDFQDFPAFFADCKARGRELTGVDRDESGKLVNMPFGLVSPMEQLKIALNWWRLGQVPQDCKGK